jgi:hypothetical protein
MKSNQLRPITAALLLLSMGLPGVAGAAAFVQCPGDTNGDAIVDKATHKGKSTADVRCMRSVSST